jgi:hypothetical protein
MFRPFLLAVLTATMLWIAGFTAGAQTDDATADDATETTAADDAGAESSAETSPAASSADGVDANAAPPPVAADNQMDRSTYTVRLRDLEDRVNRLKEEIFRSKARLSLLAETVLEKKIAGAKAAIVFKNKMGGSFRLNKATFLLDGGPIFSKSDTDGELSKREELNLFDGPVTPGDHTLSVILHYKGHGYGIFAYLKGYAFKTRSSYTFTVTEGQEIHLEVVGFEKGGATTPLEERPAVRYVEQFSDYDGDKNKAASEDGSQE